MRHDGPAAATYAPHGNRCGYGERHGARQQQARNQRYGTDVAARPQHDRRNVAYGRPSTAAVGRYDYHARKPQPLVCRPHKTTHDHYHYDRRCHVVQHGRHKECHHGDYPQQTVSPARGDTAGQNREAAVGVDHADYRHRPYQKYQCLARIAQMRHQLGRYIRPARQRQNRPYGRRHQQRDGRLVDLQPTLQGYARIARNEYRYNRNYHFTSIVKRPWPCKCRTSNSPRSRKIIGRTMLTETV